MIQRGATAAAGQPLIQLQQVSKRFAMHRERQRSFQEMFIRLAKRQAQPRAAVLGLEQRVSGGPGR